MALPSSQVAYEGAGLGETHLASVSVQRPRASVYFEQEYSSSVAGFLHVGPSVLSSDSGL